MWRNPLFASCREADAGFLPALPRLLETGHTQPTTEGSGNPHQFDAPSGRQPGELRPAGRTSVSQALSESQGRLQQTVLGVQRRLYLILGSPVLRRAVSSHVSIQPALSTPPDMRAGSSLPEVQQSPVSESVAGVLVVERLWDSG